MFMHIVVCAWCFCGLAISFLGYQKNYKILTQIPYTQLQVCVCPPAHDLNLSTTENIKHYYRISMCPLLCTSIIVDRFELTVEYIIHCLNKFSIYIVDLWPAVTF
jgi:hypothetical protein